MLTKQRTISQPVSITGIGLHTGNHSTMTFKPAPENYGIRFKRIDLINSPEILADIDHVIDILKRWTQTHSSQELFELGQSMRFPWAPVSSPEQVLESPQLKVRGFFIDVDHPEIGTSFKYAGIPYQLSSTSLGRWKRAPLIGEDNVQNYQKELGFSDE